MPLHFPTPQLLRQGFVHKEIERIHDALSRVHGNMTSVIDGVEHDAAFVSAVRDALAEVLRTPEADRGQYYSHNSLVSLVQSVVDEELAQKRMVGAAESDAAPAPEHDREAMGQPFTRLDLVGWGADILLSLIKRVIEGTHPFNPTPAQAELEDGARLILLSDWGTGREGAAAVGRMTERFLGGGPDQPPTHVFHLGDCYYSGTPNEQIHNLLAPWPVPPSDVGDVASWALNGNHDMYSGGHGLFETTLRDPRFAQQQGAGRPTTWALLRGSAWNVLALDTAWHDRLIELNRADGKLVLDGGLGHLTDDQHALIQQVAAEDKRLLVLSHHQLFVAYGDEGPTPLAGEIVPLLGGRVVDAWFWGHEHDCMAYDPMPNVRYARSVGNGAVPEVVRSDPATPLDADGSLVKPVAGDDLPQDHPRRHVSWEYRGYRIGGDGEHWMKHGFAVLDFDGDRITARYLDDEGKDIVAAESLT